jgi:uncharacterized protein (DUF2235 family)
MPRKGGFRHLIYFIDGTWLWAGSNSTLDVYSNVYLLNTFLKSDDRNGRAQIVQYLRGLGAVAGTNRYKAGLFAFGIDELIADLYVNICSNFEPGDKLYIFGFSRGAVVARALSGLLSKGILDARHINMFAHVWADYIGENEVTLPGLPEDAPNPKRPVAEYKSLCSDPAPKIEFLGVFDTVVGGHGLFEVEQRLRLRGLKVAPHVKNAVQLLAIDETRNFFKPIMWTGKASEKTYLEQIWMPGVHSDVGGAYSNRFLGDLSLLTMIDRVLARTSLNFELSELRGRDQLPRDGKLVHIHDELSRIAFRFSSQPRLVNQQCEQTIHPFAASLDGRAIKYKSKGDSYIYRLSDDFKKLAKATSFISDELKDLIQASSKAVRKRKPNRSKRAAIR